MPIEAPQNPGNRHDEPMDRHEPQNPLGRNHDERPGLEQNNAHVAVAPDGLEAAPALGQQGAPDALVPIAPPANIKPFVVFANHLPGNIVHAFNAGLSFGFLSSAIPAVHQFLSNRSTAGILGAAGALGILLGIPLATASIAYIDQSVTRLKNLGDETGRPFGGALVHMLPLPFGVALVMAGLTAGRTAGAIFNNAGQNATKQIFGPPAVFMSLILVSLLLARKMNSEYIGDSPQPLQPKPRPQPRLRQQPQQINYKYFTPNEMKKFFSKAGAPFDAIFNLTVRDEIKANESILRQLRFFSAMEGPAEPFGIKFNETGGNEIQHKPGKNVPNMKTFVELALKDQEQKLFTLSFHQGKTKIQIHGDHNANIGKALYSISGEFRRSLTMALERDLKDGNHKTMQSLFDSIANWCFDGSINQLNRFLLENALSEVDLSLVPNMDNATTLGEKSAEFLRVFRLSTARKFTEETGSPAQDENGTLAEAYERDYFSAKTFQQYLKTSDSASMLTDDDRKRMLTWAKDMELIS